MADVIIVFCYIKRERERDNKKEERAPIMLYISSKMNASADRELCLSTGPSGDK
jgi:hypothetical protein